MGAPASGGGYGTTLPQQVQGAYQGALGQYGQLGQAGSQILSGSTPYAQQGGSAYGAMTAGGLPQDVQAGQLSQTNLQPYMNPYQQSVIDATMNQLQHQEGIQQQGIDDAAQRQNAFGGDRMYLQKGVLGGEFDRQAGQLLSDLNSKNFLNAQQMGQYDIGQRSAADQFNATMRGNLYGTGASGLSQLGLGGAQLGGQLGTNAAQGLAQGASGGFTMANAANAAQVAAAQAQQQQQQQAIDAANANYARLLGIPTSYLQSMLGIASGLGNFGTTKGAQSTDPGIWSQLAAGSGILSQIAGIPIGV